MAPKMMSLEDSLAHARPLVHWHESELREAAQRVAAVATIWCARLQPAPALEDAARALPRAVARHAADAGADLRAAGWRACSSGTVIGPWWAFEGDPATALCTALFGDAPGATQAAGAKRVAQELADDAWNELLAELAAAAQASVDETFAHEAALNVSFRPWSGAIVVELPWFGGSLRLLFGAESVARLVTTPRAPHGRRPGTGHDAPVDVLTAMADAPMRLRVLLDAFDLDLGSLVALQVGDVLRTGHGLHRPAALSAHDAPQDAAPLCLGWLGRRDGRLAVELLRSPQGAAR
jgi:hypothetical protein